MALAMSDAGVLLRDVEHEGRRSACLVSNGLVVALTDRIDPPHGTRVLDAHGGALLPGLTDHHLHLYATAAAATSIDVGGTDGLDALREAKGEGWIRALGAAGELRRTDLDALDLRRPARVQHRSGALWTLNSLAITHLEASGPALTHTERTSGQLWRADDQLRRLLGSAVRPDLTELGRFLAGRGVTHLVDASPHSTPDDIAHLAAGLPQHVRSLAADVSGGPRKIVVPDHELPSFDDLLIQIEAARNQGRAVAVHCVTQAALALTIAALAAVGSIEGDRIEHAAVCDDAAAAALAELGVVVVTQPSLVWRHGDRYLADSDPRDRPWLWRHAGLIRAGVRVAVSSDAPYGDPDPWQTIATATDRRTASGVVLGPAEAVSARTALDSLMSTEAGHPPRHLAVGGPADLCVLDRTLAEALSNPRTAGIQWTLIAGQVVHSLSANSSQRTPDDV